jgi:tRNA modification GTPase
VTDTIFALSSGAPPAAIAVVRISGPQASTALACLTGRPVPAPRMAVLRTLRGKDGEHLDQALTLHFPGPATATGEELVELHCHGGRAIVAAVEQALLALDCRRAEPGEFTRRAFQNGRVDLAQAEGLADLLAADTELQRRAALDLVEGRFSQQIVRWRDAVLRLSAFVEASLDFADYDGAGDLPAGFRADLQTLAQELEEWLARPRSDRLKDGIRVVIAGPPNAGKSTLFNALLAEDAAIISPEAGTTRDALERNVAIAGVPFTLIDTAGLRSEGAGEIELIGIARARAHMARADIVLWLGPEGQGSEGAWEIDSRIDADDYTPKQKADHRVSGRSGEGLHDLIAALVAEARTLLPRPGQVAISERQAQLIEEGHHALVQASAVADELVIGEHLRQVRVAFDRLLGQTATEDMLDTLFGRFCIGK